MIASIAFGLIAACYALRQYCDFKATLSNGKEDDQSDTSSVPVYCPDSFNRPPLISTKHNHPFDLFGLNNISSKNKIAPLFSIEIKPLTDSTRISRPHFHILDYNVKNKEIVEFLIECQTSKDPEIQALWDKETDKVYLVGGKNDVPTSTGDSSWTIAPYHSFWIRLDLTTIDKKGMIHFCARFPVQSIIAGPFHTIVQIIPEEELHFLSV